MSLESNLLRQSVGRQVPTTASGELEFCKVEFQESISESYPIDYLWMKEYDKEKMSWRLRHSKLTCILTGPKKTKFLRNVPIGATITNASVLSPAIIITGLVLVAPAVVKASKTIY